MRHSKIIYVLVALVTIAASASIGAQTEVVVEGTVVDSACYLGMKMTGNDHGEMQGCGAACLRGGQPAGLVTSDGTMYTIVAPAGKLAEYVGQRVRVSGTYHSGAIMAMKAELHVDGQYSEIDVKGMM